MTWAPDYVDAEQAADYLKIDDDDDHPALLLAIAGSSRAIDKECGRQFGVLETADTFYYRAGYDYEDGCWYVVIDDLMTTTDLAISVDGTTVTTGYTLTPRNAAKKSRPWTRLIFGSDAEARPRGVADEVAITARFGWLPGVPTAIEAACLLQLSGMHLRRDAPFGSSGSPEVGASQAITVELDPAVRLALAGYTRAALPR